jgi:uncharacterized membrane protein
MAAKKQAKTSKVPQFVKKEAIDFGFKVSKANILYFLPVFVVVIIVQAGISAISSVFQIQKNPLLSLVFSLIKIIVGLSISIGFIGIALDFVDGKKPKVFDVFQTKSIVNYFVVSMVTSIATLVGLILFIIPGIIIAIKLQLATYLVVDKNMGISDSLNKSWEMTKGVKLNLFLFGFLLALINLLGVLCLVVGLIVTVPLTMVATAYVYRKLLAQAS